MTSPSVTKLTIPTPHGPAAVHLHPAANPRAALVLGHGAGGGVEAPDLVAATEAGVAEGSAWRWSSSPIAWRDGAPAPAHHLDAAWIAVAERLADRELSGLPLVTGGRSAGARVACRTAEATGAAGVLCLAFPLQPPARKGKPPAPDRMHELDD